MSTKNPKTSSKKIWVLFAGLFALLLCWSGYWIFGAHVMKRMAHEKIAAFAARGYQINVGEMRVSGWPYRFALDIPNVEVMAPTNTNIGRFFTPNLRIHAMAWNISHVIVELAETGRYRSNSDQEFMLRAEQSRASLVFADGHVSRLSLEILTPHIQDGADEDVFIAKNIFVHLRPGSNADSRDVFIASNAPNWPNTPVRNISDIHLRGEVFSVSALESGGGLSAFRTASGHIRVEEGTIETLDSTASLSGALQIDSAGFLDGPITIKLDHPRKFLAQLDKEKMDVATQKVISTLFMLAGEVETTKLSFRLKKGGIYSGPFRLARAPKVIK